MVHSRTTLTLPFTQQIIFVDGPWEHSTQGIDSQCWRCGRHSFAQSSTTAPSYGTQTDIQELEQVQRSFIRKIQGIQHLSYWEQLKETSLYSLERRRERYQVIYLWRILEYRFPTSVAQTVKSKVVGNSEKRTPLPSPPCQQKWHHSSSELVSLKFCCTCSLAVQLPARLH